MFGIDDAGRFTFATEEFAAVLDRTPAELVGTPVEVVVAAEDRETLATARQAVSSASDRTESCQVRFPQSDLAGPVTVELTTATDESIVGSLCRATEVSDPFQYLFDLIQDAVVGFEIVNFVPIVRTVNPAFVETFGYDREEIVGEPLNDYIVPGDRVEEAVDYDQRTASGEVNYAVVSRKTADGCREFIYRGVPYDTTDGRRCGFAMYTDVTDSRRQKRRLRVLHRVLRHNLRNELSVVFGMSEYVRAHAADSSVSLAASRALDAADRLAAVSEKARNVETALDGEADQSVDAAALARSVADSYRPDTPVETALPRQLPVSGGTAVYDALDNLVENAVRHTPDGTTVRITAERAGGDAFVRVLDDGPGIPAVERTVVFDDEDITNLQHGSGLGIWLARWVAEAAGGGIEYDRADGWTTVSVRLPLTDADDVLTLADTAESESEPTPK
ncbi:PAS domain S-box protein [Haloarcula sp. CBA1130]|uniref:sensor histidine kinase n=1 Tax=unclassified Haloarcula TaxID=2624677 RepID=UPI0012450D69|nr:MULTISPECIES: ATP-binding protein [unclassified Haloarcula]KAA9399485.1 PAS domain S-box protein [Haloarcula sp. CBA1129]KAA9401208.1 PAS domain S-box protein [Haloarcula sp. CBA1130]